MTDFEKEVREILDSVRVKTVEIDRTCYLEFGLTISKHKEMIDEALAAIKSAVLKALPKEKCTKFTALSLMKSRIRGFNAAISEMEQRIKGGQEI